MLKVILVFASLLFSIVCKADFISHAGYSRPADSQIISGGGLEWMRWDLTFGKTVHNILKEPTFSGWRLATPQEMTHLFNAFSFGKNDWQAEHGTSQYSVKPYDLTDLNSWHQKFHNLFGVTLNENAYQVCNDIITTQCYLSYDRPAESIAWYGSVNSEQIGLATISDDSVYVDENGEYVISDGYADLSPEYYDSFLENDDSPMKWIASIALVREPAPVNIQFPVLFFLWFSMVLLNSRRSFKI